ncbi:hypothetical protein [Embleya sp. NPDC001921]
MIRELIAVALGLPLEPARLHRPTRLQALGDLVQDLDGHRQVFAPLELHRRCRVRDRVSAEILGHGV